MINMKAYLGLAVFMLLISSCFVPTVVSQSNASIEQTNTITPFQADPEPTNTSVVLVSPVHNATIDNDFNVSFTFEPRINGTGNVLWGASLVVNGTTVENNQTTIVPYQNNTIYHKFSTNGTYTWNIRLSNNSDVVWAPEDFNFTIAIPEKDTGIAVELITPTNDHTITDDFNVTFVYKPSINGTENKFYKATLVVNNTVVTTNQTAITADENNTFYCVFNKNGTYTWNIRLENETTIVTASSNYNFTLAVHTEPTATPTPTPTPTPTVTPTPTPKPATATPSPTPTPEISLDIWTLIIIAVIVFSVVLIVTIFILRRRAR